MRITLDRPVIVEGKYDKIKLESLVDGVIITTEGFGIFKNKEKLELIKRLCEKNGVIIATDSDSAGMLIRGHLKGCLPPDKIVNVHIPQIKGKERRKTVPSKQGYLGVEGTDTSVLFELLAPYAKDTGEIRRAGLSKREFYERGLSGADGSKQKRQRLCRLAGLPPELSANALLDALDTLYSREQLDSLFEALEK